MLLHTEDGSDISEGPKSAQIIFSVQKFNPFCVEVTLHVLKYLNIFADMCKIVNRRVKVKTI